MTTGSGRNSIQDSSSRILSPVFVEFLTGRRAGEQIELPFGETRIGRAPGNDLVVDDISVSHYHASLLVGDDSITLTDHGSTNKVMLEDGPIFTSSRIEIDQLFLIGRYWMRLRTQTRAGESLQPSSATRLPVPGSDRVKVNSAWLAAIGMFGRLLAVGTHITVAGYFGDSRPADAYFASETVPEMFILLAGTGLAMTSVPIYSRLRERRDDNAEVSAHEFAGGLAVATTLFFLVVTGLLYLLAPNMIDLLAPGLDDETSRQAVSLLRIMTLVMTFLGPDSALRTAFNANRHFVTPEVARVLYSGVLLASIAVLGPHVGINAVAWGMVVGAGVMTVVQAVVAWRMGLIKSLTFRIPSECWGALRQIPTDFIVVGWPIGLMLLDRAAASHDSMGAVASLGYAGGLILILIGVVVVPATLRYPSLSDPGAGNPPRFLGVNTTEGLRIVFYVVLPVAATIYVGREVIVQLLYERGAFGDVASARTSSVVGAYSSALPGLAVVFFLRSAFLSLGRSTRLAALSVSTLVLSWGLNQLVIGRWGLDGIIWATSLTTTIMAVAAIANLRSSCHVPIAALPLARSLGLMLLAAISATITMGIVNDWLVAGNSQSVIRRINALAVAVLVGIAIYLLTTRIFGLAEAKLVLGRLRRLRPGLSKRVGPVPRPERFRSVLPMAASLLRHRAHSSGQTSPRARASVFAIGAMVLMLLSSFGIGSFLGIVSSRLQGLEVPLLAVVLVGPTILWAAVKRFDAMVVLAAALLGVVQREPAPVDLLISLLFPIGILSGRLDLNRLKREGRVNTLVWVFLALTAIAVGGSQLVLTSTRYALITVYCVGIAYFVKLYVKTPEDMGRLVGGYVLGSVVAMGLVVFDLIGIVPDEIVIQQGRTRGLTKDPNVFAPSLIPVLVLLVDEAWRPYFTRRLPKFLLYLAAGLTLLGIFTSFSRAAWANAVLTLALYAALNIRHLSAGQRMRAFGWAGAAAFGIMLFTSLAGMGEFLSQRASVLQNYDSERFAAQRTAIELGLLHPFGIGPGVTDVDLFPPHSSYLRNLAETGALSLIVFLMLMVALLLPFRNRWLVNSRLYGVQGSVILAVAIGQIVNGLVIDTLHWRHFWLFIGMVWLGHGMRREASKPGVAETASSARNREDLVVSLGVRSDRR